MKHISKFIEIVNVFRENVDAKIFYLSIIAATAIIVIIICRVVGVILDKKLGKKENLSFESQHPSLNKIVDLAIVVAFFSIIFIAIIYIGKAIVKFITLITTIASNLEVVIIVALITGAVSITGVIISSIVAKVIDYKKNRREYLAQKREEPYKNFIDMVYKIQGNSKNRNAYTEEMMVKDISKFSKELTLWGSSKVIDKWVKFKENGANQESGTENLFLLEEIMNEMRKDLGLKKVNKGNLLAFFVNDIKEYIKK